jgi:hypothetical protein
VWHTRQARLRRGLVSMTMLVASTFDLHTTPWTAEAQGRRFKDASATLATVPRLCTSRRNPVNALFQSRLRGLVFQDLYTAIGGCCVVNTAAAASAPRSRNDSMRRMAPTRALASFERMRAGNPHTLL